ncbi:hypothetical protein LLH06_07940 [Mucilaginibacter daejeonensis]|uniref:hypothetical protein n=1 Tax=Mucilaginibacter daejeonensis TaxID=398049 RepID=UPI001D1724B9|nr:hypothetical protein [Mucilaginibacter daejeonensis]UEG54894.1 hypothetical protein LLH06_07940 [Mucilaginibacter daejeonensis]
MKKYLIIVIIAIIAINAIACQNTTNHDGIYTAHLKGEYSVADDTLIVNGNFITRRTGYQKIRKGKLLPEGHKTRTWQINSENAPPVLFKEDQVIIGHTIYTKAP